MVAVPAKNVMVQMDFVNCASYNTYIDFEYVLNTEGKSIFTQIMQPGSRARFQLPSHGIGLLISIGADSGEGTARKTVFGNTYSSVIARTINFGGTLDSPSWIER